MSPRDWKFRLEDIAESLGRIADYVKGMDYEAWAADRKTIDAVIRNLEIIGEAANNIPGDIQEGYPELPWSQMKGLRNILIHEYLGVDSSILWETIQKDLPVLKVQIVAILSGLK